MSIAYVAILVSLWLLLQHPVSIAGVGLAGAVHESQGSEFWVWALGPTEYLDYICPWRAAITLLFPLLLVGGWLGCRRALRLWDSHRPLATINLTLLSLVMFALALNAGPVPWFVMSETLGGAPPVNTVSVVQAMEATGPGRALVLRDALIAARSSPVGNFATFRAGSERLLQFGVDDEYFRVELATYHLGEGAGRVGRSLLSPSSDHRLLEIRLALASGDHKGAVRLLEQARAGDELDPEQQLLIELAVGQSPDASSLNATIASGDPRGAALRLGLLTALGVEPRWDRGPEVGSTELREWAERVEASSSSPHPLPATPMQMDRVVADLYLASFVSASLNDVIRARNLRKRARDLAMEAGLPHLADIWEPLWRQLDT